MNLIEFVKMTTQNPIEVEVDAMICFILREKHPLNICVCINTWAHDRFHDSSSRTRPSAAFELILSLLV